MQRRTQGGDIRNPRSHGPRVDALSRHPDLLVRAQALVLLLRFITRVCNVAFGLFEMRLDCCCACFFCEGRSCRGSSLVRLVQGSYGLHERRTTAVIMMVMVMVMLQGPKAKHLLLPPKQSSSELFDTANH